MAGQLADTVMAVVPIAGLLAETSHTGSLTESDARDLHAVAGFAPFDLIDLLDSDDDAPVPPQVRGRLVDLLGEYGTLHVRDIAAQGAAALNEGTAPALVDT